MPKKKKELKIYLLENNDIKFETSEGWDVGTIVRVLSKLLNEILHTEALHLDWQQKSKET